MNTRVQHLDRVRQLARAYVTDDIEQESRVANALLYDSIAADEDPLMLAFAAILRVRKEFEPVGGWQS